MTVKSTTTTTTGDPYYDHGVGGYTYTLPTINVTSGSTYTWQVANTVTTSTTWNPNTTVTIGASSMPFTNDINADALDVKGKAIINGELEVKGDIKMGEHLLSERLHKIEERLAILNQNPDLESRWEPLKKLGEEYRAIEKDLLDKEKMWEILQK